MATLQSSKSGADLESQVQGSQEASRVLMKTFPWLNQRFGYLPQAELEQVYGSVVIQRLLAEAVRIAGAKNKNEIIEAFRVSQGSDVRCSETIQLFEELCATKEPIQALKKEPRQAIQRIDRQCKDAVDVATQHLQEQLDQLELDVKTEREQILPELQKHDKGSDEHKAVTKKLKELNERHQVQKKQLYAQIGTIRTEHEAIAAQEKQPFEERLNKIRILQDDKVLEEYQLGFISFSVLVHRLMKKQIQSLSSQFKKTMEQRLKNGNNAGLNGLHRSAIERYIKLLRDSMQRIFLAYPEDLDMSKEAYQDSLKQLLAYAHDMVVRLAHVLSDFHGNQFLHELSERGQASLFYEFLNVLLYPEYHLEFRVGLGGTEDDANVRLCIYPVFALQMIESFIRQGTGNVPRLRILNAYHLAVTNNGMDELTAHKNALVAESLFQAMIHRFYPECEPHVHYTMPHTDEVCDTDRFRTDLQLLQALVKDEVTIRQFAEEKVGEGKTPKKYNLRVSRMKKALRVLYERGEKHGGEKGRQNALDYIAVHPQSELFGNTLALVNVKSQPDGVVKFGGAGEHSFDLLQEFLVAHFDNDGQSFLPNTSAPDEEARIICVTQRVGGDPPPYYSAGEAEVTLCAQSLGQFGSSADMQKHYQQSFEDGDTAQDVVLLVGLFGEDFLPFLLEFAGIGQHEILA